MEPIPWALNQLTPRPDHRTVFACELDPNARHFISLAHRGRSAPQTVYLDVTKRDPQLMPACDVYVAGFPCQPFSCQGSLQGMADTKGRGTVIWHLLEYIRVRRPRAFILENVCGLVRLFRQDLDAIMANIRNIGSDHSGPGHYVANWMCLNTADHGIPQSRPRLFIVGLARDFLVQGHKFHWPRPLPQRPSLSTVVHEARPTKEVLLQREADAMAKLSKSRRVRLQRSFAQIRAAGLDRHKEDAVVDMDAFTVHWVKGHCPCLTRTRAGAGAFWLTSHGRVFSLAEMLRLQGMPSDLLLSTIRRRHARDHPLRKPLSQRQVGQLVGNAMSVNVLSRLLARVLPAVGLSGPLATPWDHTQEMVKHVCDLRSHS